MRRIAALMAECEDTITSGAIAEERRTHLEKLTKVKDAAIKVAPRTYATTIHDDGARTARWSARWYEQTLNGHEDFSRASPAMMHLTMMLVEPAPKGHVAAIGDCSGAFCQSPLKPRRNTKPSSDRAGSRGRAGTRLHLGSRSQGSTGSVGHVQCEPFLIHGIATALGEHQSKRDTRSHQRESTGRRRRITHTKCSTNPQDMC